MNIKKPVLLQVLNVQYLKFSAVILILMALTARLQAAPLTTGADFLLLTTGARPDGMGQAFSAVADDVNTLNFNPAGLGNIRLPEVGYSHVGFFGDISYDYIGAALPAGGLGVFGFGYLGLGTAPFNSTADPSAPAGTASDRALIGGWGRSFYDFQVGGAVKYITRQVGSVQGSGFGFDGGLRVRLSPALTLAAAVLNLGPGIQMASLEPLPTVLDGGAAFTLLEDSNHTVNLAADANYNFTTDTQRYGFGAEYWFKDLVALRAGYLADSPDEGFSAGAGIRISFIQLDYAFQPYATLGPVHRFSGLLRWDGPWVSGGEPNPPEHVNIVNSPGLLQIRWQKSTGPVAAYEAVLQPLDGRPPVVSPQVVNAYYSFKVDPDTLYKVSVRALGSGGARSYPSQEAYVESRPAQPYSAAGSPGLSISRGVEGKVDLLGLRLSWTPPPGVGDAAYNLYRLSPDGSVVRVTREPKRADRLWVTDISGLEGTKWIVTLVDSKGREGTLGTYEFHPTAAEMDTAARPSSIRLYATAEPGRRIFLDWDKTPEGGRCALLLSHKADGVYEFYGNVIGSRATLLMKAPRKEKYFFLLVPDAGGGEWDEKSNEVEVDMGEFDQWVVPGSNPVQTVK